MRRWPAALACVVALIVPAGCAVPPEGVDGDLTNAWPAMPAARQFRPDNATCHADMQPTATLDEYAPVACATPHLAETIAVEDLTDVTALTKPDASRQRAYADCSRRAAEFLGGDWRTGWLILQPVLPSAGAWSGGAHWFRCDLAETSPVDGALVRRSGTLKGSVGSDGRLRMACVNPTIDGSRVTELHPVACGTAHTAEFAGLWSAPNRSSASLTTAQLEKGCDAAIAKFVGISNDRTIRNRVGWLGFPPDDAAWELGDRAVRCFLWLDGEKMRGSYRNAGKAKLKIHYAR